MVIYKGTNLINGKVYIGATTRYFKKRIKEHNKFKRNSVVSRAIRKYGKANFKWQVICICPNLDSLNEQEQYYIAFYNTINCNFGYNQTTGGSLCTYSQATKQRMSKIAKEQYKQGRINNMRGISPSKETRAKLATVRKKMWQDPVYKKQAIKNLKKAGKKTYLKIEYKGMAWNLADLSKYLGMPYHTLRCRLFRYNIPKELMFYKGKITKKMKEECYEQVREKNK